MMNFKPFYVKTESTTPKKAQHLFNLAVENGANRGGYFHEPSSIYPGYSHCLLLWRYFGVNDMNNVYVQDNSEYFGSEAVELTYEEALLHIQGNLVTVNIPSQCGIKVDHSHNRDSDLLLQAASELSSYIDKENSILKSKIGHDDLDPPDYHDYQTCQELVELAYKLRMKEIK